MTAVEAPSGTAIARRDATDRVVRCEVRERLSVESQRSLSGPRERAAHDAVDGDGRGHGGSLRARHARVGGSMAASGANDVRSPFRRGVSQSSSFARRTSGAMTTSAGCSHAASTGRTRFATSGRVWQCSRRLRVEREDRVPGRYGRARGRSPRGPGGRGRRAGPDRARSRGWQPQDPRRRGG